MRLQTRKITRKPSSNIPPSPFGLRTGKCTIRGADKNRQSSGFLVE